MSSNLKNVPSLTLLHSEWPKLYGVLAVLSAKGLRCQKTDKKINVCVIKKNKQTKNKFQPSYMENPKTKGPVV